MDKKKPSFGAEEADEEDKPQIASSATSDIASLKKAAAKVAASPGAVAVVSPNGSDVSSLKMGPRGRRSRPSSKSPTRASTSSPTRDSVNAPPPNLSPTVSSQAYEYDLDFTAVPGAEHVAGPNAMASSTPASSLPAPVVPPQVETDAESLQPTEVSSLTSPPSAVKPHNELPTAMAVHAEVVVVDDEKRHEVQYLRQDLHDLRQQNQDMQRRVCCIAIVVAIILILLGSALGFYFGLRSVGGPSPTPVPTMSPTIPGTPFPTNGLGLTLSTTIQNEQSAISFDDPGSAASRALDWMTNDDASYTSSLSFSRILQRFALVTLWFSLEGWNNDGGGWLRSGTHECDWNDSNYDKRDVTCNDSRQVRKVQICCGGLTGKLPEAELSLLTRLTLLDVHSNAIGGTLSTWLGSIRQMKWLDMFNNQFVGTIPTQIGNLRLLEWWSVAENGLLGTLPTEVALLTKLSIVYFHGTDVTGSIPSNLCPNLERADIECDKLACDCCQDHSGTQCSQGGSSPVPPPTPSPTTTFRLNLESMIRSRVPSVTFEDPTSPQSLAVDWMTTDDASYSSGLSEQRLLQRFALTTLWYSTGGEWTWNQEDVGWVVPGLRECAWNDSNYNKRDVTCNNEEVIRVQICCGGLVGKLPGAELSLLTRLELLDVHSNRMTGTLPTWLGSFPVMSWLDLYDNNFDGTIPTEIGKLSNTLVWWSVAENNLVGMVPTEMAQLTKLSIIFFQGTDLSGSIPSNLCSSLEQADIDCPDLDCDCCQDHSGTECP